MSRFYIANEELGEYLKSLKFDFHDREEDEVKYYTHSKTGKQVKVNTKTKLITFLTPEGDLITDDTSFTNNQIEYFLQKE